MIWGSVSEFVAMGGYGFYVWGAFGVSALVLLAEVVSLRARRKALRTSQSGARSGPHAELHGAPHEA